MKDFESAITFVRNWIDSNNGAFDGRDVARFGAFVPFDRVDDVGLKPKDGMTADQWGDVEDWNTENVLKQLRADAEFGLEKAEAERGLSAGCMFATVNMWCGLLENDLQRTSYNDYGVSFLTEVLSHYGWIQSKAPA